MTTAAFGRRGMTAPAVQVRSSVEMMEPTSFAHASEILTHSGATAGTGRVMASAIDGTLVVVVAASFFVACVLVDVALGTHLKVVGVLGTLLILLLGGSVYRAVCEASDAQATIGKRVFGLVVTDHHGARIGLGQALGRNILGKIFFLFAPFHIGHLIAFGVPSRHTLYEMLTGTEVRRRFDGNSVGHVFG